MLADHAAPQVVEPGRLFGPRSPLSVAARPWGGACSLPPRGPRRRGGLLRSAALLLLLLGVTFRLGSAVAQPAQIRVAPVRPLGGPALDEALDLSLPVGRYLVLAPRAQYRARYYAHAGRDLRPGNNFDAFTQRARVGLEARLLSWYSAYLELQDVRMWGEETSTLSDFSADGLDLHQAWAEARCPRGIGLRVGRQELAYDNHRLLGNADWNPQGRSFDGARLAASWRWLQGHLFYARLAEKDAYLADPTGKVLRGAPRDADLAGLWLRAERWEPWRPSLMALYDGQGTRRQHRFTGGLFMDGQPWRGLGYTAEIYLQAGEEGESGVMRNIFAFLAAGSLSYAAPLPGRPSLGGWVELVSGDDDPAHGTSKSFDTLFATNHRFYGLMDYFLTLPADTGGRGLLDAGLRLRAAPLRGLATQLDWHHFRFHRQHPSGSRVIGNELDLLLQLVVNRWLNLEGLLGAFFPRTGAELLRGGRDRELLGYLQLDLKI